MGKRIRKSADFYRESLSWMAYRYAIGITEYVGGRGLSEAERYRMFRDIEFDTEEFHALAGAFMDFLKRKNITDIVQLSDRYREDDLIWLSRNYAKGRHSYAASHCEGIISYSDEVQSPERKEFMAHDIRRELGDHLRFKSFFFDLPMGIERTHSPSVDDYIGWDELASYFSPSCHKKCRMVYEGKELIVPYIDSWTRIWDRSGKMRYDRVKVPIDKRLGFFRRSFLIEEYIVEDDVEVEEK